MTDNNQTNTPIDDEKDKTITELNNTVDKTKDKLNKTTIALVVFIFLLIIIVLIFVIALIVSSKKIKQTTLEQIKAPQQPKTPQTTTQKGGYKIVGGKKYYRIY